MKTNTIKLPLSRKKALKIIKSVPYDVPYILCNDTLGILLGEVWLELPVGDHTPTEKETDELDKEAFSAGWDGGEDWGWDKGYDEGIKVAMGGNYKETLPLLNDEIEKN
jgi:hypothetical protein